SVRRQRTSPPPGEDLVWPRSRPCQGTCPVGARRGPPTGPHVIEMEKKPVPAFVDGSCPAPPVSTHTSPPLPCSALARPGPGPRRDRANSYSQDTPGLRPLKHAADTPRTGYQSRQPQAFPG